MLTLGDRIIDASMIWTSFAGYYVMAWLVWDPYISMPFDVPIHNSWDLIILEVVNLCLKESIPNS